VLLCGTVLGCGADLTLISILFSEAEGLVSGLDMVLGGVSDVDGGN